MDYLGHHVLFGDCLVLCDLVFGNRCISVRSDNLECCELECDSASSISHLPILYGGFKLLRNASKDSLGFLDHLGIGFEIPVPQFTFQ